MTRLHWTIDTYNMHNINIEWANDSTAASVLLISISPAVNPLIYTFTGRNFLHSIRMFFREMKCDISVRRTSSNYHDDHNRGVERCSCISCVICVHQDEENDPQYWPTEDTSNGILIKANFCRIVKLTNIFTSDTVAWIFIKQQSNCFQCLSLHFIHIVWMFAIKIVCMYIIKSRVVVYIR